VRAQAVQRAPAFIGTTEVVLHSPTQVELQRALDAASAAYVGRGPRAVTVRGDAFVYQASLPSHVVLDLSRGWVGCSATPLVGLADDGTNCLFTAERTRDATPPAFLAANTSEGDYRITLEGDAGATLAAAVAARLALYPLDTYVELFGNQGGIVTNLEPNVDVTAIYAVDAVEGSTVITKSHLLTTHNRLDIGGGRPRVYLLTSVPKDITVVGGVWDCTDKNVATGIYSKGARNVKLYGQAMGGFARAPIELNHGTDGVVIDGFRSLGGNGANILAYSAHRGVVRNTSYDPDGAWLHPQGSPRSWLQIAHTSTNWDLDVICGKHVQGVVLFGGRHLDVSVRAEGINATKAAARTRGDDTNYWAIGGAALSFGAGQIGTWDEFAGDVRVHKVSTSDCRSLNATASTVYLHDVHGLAVGDILIENFRETAVRDGDGDGTPDYRNGVTISDVFKGHPINSIITRGITNFGLRLENGDGGGTLDIRYLRTDAHSPAGAGNAAGISVGTISNGRIRIHRWDHEDAGVPMLIGGTANFGFMCDQFRHGALWSDPIGPVYLARLTEGAAPAAPGMLLQVDDTATYPTRFAKNADLDGGLSGKFVFLLSTGVDGGGFTNALVTPTAVNNNAFGMARVKAADAVKYGDRLKHDGTTGKWTVDPAATSEFKVARDSKAAGAEAGILYQEP
jgi:hypothetical protein